MQYNASMHVCMYVHTYLVGVGGAMISMIVMISMQFVNG